MAFFQMVPVYQTQGFEYIISTQSPSILVQAFKYSLSDFNQ